MMGGRGGSSAVSRERMAADFEALRREQSQLGVEQQIQQAYQDLRFGPLGWADISALRDRLNIDRAKLDSVLRQLADARIIDLLPEENQKVLTPKQRADTLRYGGEDQSAFRIRARR